MARFEEKVTETPMQANKESGCWKGRRRGGESCTDTVREQQRMRAWLKDEPKVGASEAQSLAATAHSQRGIGSQLALPPCRAELHPAMEPPVS
jgi:hypothetical protein